MTSKLGADSKKASSDASGKAHEEIGPEVILKNGTRTLRVVTFLDGYKPGEVIIRPMNQKLIILARDNQEQLRSYDLPETLDPFEMEAKMTEDSILTVEAPLAG